MRKKLLKIRITQKQSPSNKYIDLNFQEELK
jgi:hypothetical protein